MIHHRDLLDRFRAYFPKKTYCIMADYQRHKSHPSPYWLQFSLKHWKQEIYQQQILPQKMDVLRPKAIDAETLKIVIVQSAVDLESSWLHPRQMIRCDEVPRFGPTEHQVAYGWY